MKPLKLTMQAFGSYGERTVIDFSVPNQRNTYRQQQLITNYTSAIGEMTQQDFDGYGKKPEISMQR